MDAKELLQTTIYFESLIKQCLIHMWIHFQDGFSNKLAIFFIQK